MKKQSTIALGLAVGTASLGILGVLAAAPVFAQSTTPTSTQRPPMVHPFGKGQGPMPFFHKNVIRNVTNLSNGVQITMTSTDAATVQKLQTMKQPTPPKDDQQNITFTQTNIDNGIQITITSPDAATVQKIQDHEKNSGPMKFGFGSKGLENRGEMGFWGKNVTRNVTNLSNGIQITMTSTDAATVQKLQTMKQPTPPKDDQQNITFTQTNIDNGIQITITSPDAATVQKLQQKPQFSGRHGHGRMAQE